MPAARTKNRRRQPADCGAARLFLEALQTGASINGAANAADKPRTTFYTWRSRYPDFAKKWDAAVEAGTDRLEDEAVRRATSGVSKPVFYGGKLVGHEKRHSDPLLMFLLKGRRPERYDPGNAKPRQGGQTKVDSEQFMKRIANILGVDEEQPDQSQQDRKE